MASSTTSTPAPHSAWPQPRSTSGRGDHRHRLEAGDRGRDLGVGGPGLGDAPAVQRGSRRPAHHRALVTRRLGRHARRRQAFGHRRIREAGDAVEGEQRAVQVGPAIAEQTPPVALGAQLVEVERGADHRLARAVGLGDLGARGVGDERRAVERDLGRRADLVADAVGGDQRHQVGAGVALHHPLPVAARVPGRIGRLAADRRGVAAAPRRRAAPSPGPTRGTTGPSRCRRRSWRARVVHTRKPVSPRLK